MRRDPDMAGLLAGSPLAGGADAYSAGAEVDHTYSVCTRRDNPLLGTLRVDTAPKCPKTAVLDSWNEKGPTGPQGEQGIPGRVFNTYTVTHGSPWLYSGIVEKKVFCYPGDLALSTSIRWWYGDPGTVTVSEPYSSVSGDTGAKTTTNADGWWFEFARSGPDHGA